ncbi:MAG TPA: hypothetical protein VKS21_13085 [Spirochaetota bacterium]|nr:hypothetical protein [Spirochaetota bacterium]
MGDLRSDISKLLTKDNILQQKIYFLLKSWLESDFLFNSAKAEMRMEAFITIPGYEHRRPKFTQMPHIDKPDCVLSTKDYFDAAGPLFGSADNSIKEFSKEFKMICGDFITTVLVQDTCEAVQIRLVLGNRSLQGTFNDYWNEAAFFIR